jgi:hypothetical protein
LHPELPQSRIQIADFAAADQSAAIASESQISELRHSLSEIERTINDAVHRDHELKGE